MSMPLIPRRGTNVLIYGVAPHIVIRPYYDGRRWRARIYAATFTREGLIRWCGRIRYFYICYTVSASYCTRTKESRNLYYEMRICTIISEPLLDRYIIVRRREGMRAYLNRVHAFINSVASLLVNRLYDRFEDFVEEDAGPDYAREATTLGLIRMIDVVAPIIDPPCGVRATARVVRPMRRTYYFVRCRCPKVEPAEVEKAVARLTEYMPAEQLQDYVTQLIMSWKALGLPGSPEEDITIAHIERWLSEYAAALELRRNCRDVTRQTRWLTEYARYVRSEEFFRRAFRQAFG